MAADRAWGEALLVANIRGNRGGEGAAWVRGGVGGGELAQQFSKAMPGSSISRSARSELTTVAW